LDIESAAAQTQTFAMTLRSTLFTAEETRLARPERLIQVLATVRDFYMHLVRHGAVSLEVLDHLHETVELGERGVRSYSQHGEDLQIAYYIRKRERATYIDVGCLWPKHFSNSYFFYERGGRGLCIDANPTVAEEYNRMRPHDVFLNCGIAASQGTMTYYMHDNPVFNTFSADHAAELAGRVAAMEDSPQREGRELTGTLEVPTMTLDQAIESTGFAAMCSGRVDFLSIDVEGLELEVLSGFDFRRPRPSLVVIEDVRRGTESKRSLEEIPTVGLVQAHGYSLAGQVGINLYFVDQER
jgi:FkbM family methyltransferase